MDVIAINCIEVHHLNKSFGSKKVLDNLTLTIEHDSIVAIVGSNGIGKSVFLNCLLNFMDYDSGEINILNENHNNHNFLRTVTSFVSVDNQLHLEKVTGKEYFDLIISIYNLPEESVVAKYTSFAEELNVINQLDSTFSSLSFGTKKKIQLIGSILYNPKVLVCDEIFEGLDHEAVNWVKAYFLKRKANGEATLFTSHIMDHTWDISDYIYRLENGKLHSQKNEEMTERVVE
ncbi:ABC transporter ATP-binding protein [Peribacillus simplex]|uniref:ABC transporter ATP-binding protein n=1 Tax=Peribacillus simplex TaxID=1478 RepID=A0A9X8ZGM8_9BACI|nr:ABC transporter ATP-binding protein [Peribacillus simplex]TKH10530.1 ABC transporter ATP-binding protein [Peribacillus simplex]